jgi:hypothetical protein
MRIIESVRRNERGHVQAVIWFRLESDGTRGTSLAEGLPQGIFLGLRLESSKLGVQQKLPGADGFRHGEAVSGMRVAPVGSIIDLV